MSNVDFVKEADEMRHYAKVADKMKASEHKQERRSFVKTIALIAMLPIAASGWIAREVTPKIVKEYDLIPVAPDGTIVRKYRPEELPINARRDYIGVDATWDYVLARESYTSHLMAKNWNEVSAMSSPDVMREYQEAHDAKNEKSPYRKYGERGWIMIEKDSFTHLIPPEGYSGPPVGYLMRYWRYENMGNNSPMTRQMWVSEVRFKRGVSGIPENQRYEFNGIGIEVNFYQSYPTGEISVVKR